MKTQSAHILHIVNLLALNFDTEEQLLFSTVHPCKGRDVATDAMEKLGEDVINRYLKV